MSFSRVRLSNGPEITTAPPVDLFSKSILLQIHVSPLRPRCRGGRRSVSNTTTLLRTFPHRNTALGQPPSRNRSRPLSYGPTCISTLLRLENRAYSSTCNCPGSRQGIGVKSRSWGGLAFRLEKAVFIPATEAYGRRMRQSRSSFQMAKVGKIGETCIILIAHFNWRSSGCNKLRLNGPGIGSSSSQARFVGREWR